jgi:hypothetical protein
MSSSVLTSPNATPSSASAPPPMASFDTRSTLRKITELTFDDDDEPGVTPENYLLAITEAPKVFYDDMMKIYKSRQGES